MSSTALWQRRLESGLHAYPALIATLIVAAGFLLRLRAAGGTFLNPDEALHFLAANQTSLLAAYRASLDTAHPPLLILLLNLWRVFGSSELGLRLPSVIAGTIFCWFLFQWLTMVFGRAAGWIGLLLATLLPPMIELSSEVRQYALLLCFVTIAAYLLERALATGSAARMLLSFLFVYLGMLTHFSAVLFAAALAGYGLVRLASRPFPRAVLISSLAGQAAALGLFVFLYRTHIARLRGSNVERRSIDVVLSHSYFHWGHDHLLLFMFARTFGVCQFVFGQLAVGDLAGLAFIVGVALLLRGKAAIQPGGPSPRQLGLFLLLPFAINCAVAVADLYPYGGTRHSSFLAPFVIAGVSFLLAELAHAHPARGIGVAVLLIVLCQIFGVPHRPFMLRPDQDKQNMTHAIEAIHRQVTPAAPILVDFQTFFLIRHYLCPDSPTPVYTYTSGLGAFQCGGYKVIAPGPAVYLFSTDGFLPSWKQLVRTYHLPPGDRVWVFEAGWDVGLDRELKGHLTEVHQVNAEAFGHNIALYQLAVGQAHIP